jgi:Fic family protein
MQKEIFERNKPFNSLPFLPPEENIEEVPSVLKKLIKSSRALASVNGQILRLPNPYMLINTIALQEARTSTEIENIFTTEDELYKAISDSSHEETANPSIKEVLRYREALWAGYRAMKETEVINLKSIITIFQQIKDSKAGKYSGWVITGSKWLRSGEIILLRVTAWSAFDI